MNEDYENEEFIMENEDKKERRENTLKRIGIILLVIIGIIIIILLFKGCSNKEVDNSNAMETTLLEAGKEYYENNKHMLPTSIGECSTVSLKTLVNLGLLNPKEYDDCDVEKTYVKVCMLESKNLHWVPMLLCDSLNSEELYTNFQEGTEKDLIDGVSDIKFMFLGKYLNLDNATLGGVEELWKEDITYQNYKTLAIVNHYKYRDKEYIWNLNEKRYYTSSGEKANASEVNEYYVTSPKSGYTNKDNETAGVSKWYTLVNEGQRVYWTNDDGVHKYSATQPSPEFSYYTGGITYTRYTTRTWTKTGNINTVAPTKIWLCSSLSDSNNVTSYVPCNENVNNPTHTITEKEYYTCDNGVTEVDQNATCYRCNTGVPREDNSECGNYSGWSAFVETPCSGPTDLCKTATVTVYEWYKLVGEVRSYYPSGKANASEEKIYYKNSPVSGAIKDETTSTTAYKWYKLVSGQTTGYLVNPPNEMATKTSTFRWTSWTDWSTVAPANTSSREIERRQKIKLQKIESMGNEEWIDISTDYLTEQEMISKFKELGYSVTSLADINASGELKYEVKLYIRNKE